MIVWTEKRRERPLRVNHRVLVYWGMWQRGICLFLPMRLAPRPQGQTAVTSRDLQKQQKCGVKSRSLNHALQPPFKKISAGTFPTRWPTALGNQVRQSGSFEDFANLTRACTRNSHQRYNYAPTPQRLDMPLRERFKKSTCVTNTCSFDNSIEAVRLTPTSHLRNPTTSIYLLLNSCRLLEISVFSFLPSFSRSVPSSYPLTSCQCQTEREKCKSTMVRKYR